MAAPIIAPLDPSSNAYAQTNASSYSLSDVSTSTPFEGVAMVTTQTLYLDIYRQPKLTPTDYMRVGRGLMLSSCVAGGAVSNAGYTSAMQAIQASELRIKVTASHDRTIVTGTWTGSSTFVPQEFQVIRYDQDIKGNTYSTSGPLSSADGTVGPMSRVISTIGVDRRPWLSSMGGAYSESVQDVISFPEVTVVDPWGASGKIESNQNYWGDWAVGNPHGAVCARNSASWGWMGGDYAPVNENSGDMRNLIHNLALHLKNRGFFDGLIPAQLRSVPSYDRNWHKYGT